MSDAAFMPRPQLVALKAMATKNKPLVRHRDGWVLSDGSASFLDTTVTALRDKGLVEAIAFTPTMRITDAGRAALAVSS